VPRQGERKPVNLIVGWCLFFVVPRQFSQDTGEWPENQILILDWTYFHCPGAALQTDKVSSLSLAQPLHIADKPEQVYRAHSLQGNDGQSTAKQGQSGEGADLVGQVGTGACTLCVHTAQEEERKLIVANIKGNLQGWVDSPPTSKGSGSEGSK